MGPMFILGGPSEVGGHIKLDDTCVSKNGKQINPLFRFWERVWWHCQVPDGLVKRSRCFFFGVHSSAHNIQRPESFNMRVGEKPRWMRDSGPKLEDRLLHIDKYKSVEARLKMLGNMVVPDQGRLALHHLTRSS